jgi:hypothetical protein
MALSSYTLKCNVHLFCVEGMLHLDWRIYSIAFYLIWFVGSGFFFGLVGISCVLDNEGGYCLLEHNIFSSYILILGDDSL